MALSIEDIVALSKAGFTASQIAELNAAPAPAPQTAAPQTAAPQTAAPQTAAPQTAAPQTAAPQTAAPQTAAPQTAAPHSVDDVLAAISGLSASIQNANLLQAQMPTKQKTAETILASIINPPKKEV